MFSLYGNSVTGAVRKQNQDRYACGLFADGAAWAVVCDGMGGPGGGEIAAQTALDVVTRQFEQSYTSDLRPAQIRGMMDAAVLLANNQVYQQAVQNMDLRGMGTTIVCCIWRRETLFVLHAGDSRLYLYEPEESALTQITHDHSMVQTLVDCGEITEEEALFHPERNVITKAVGVNDAFCPEFGQYPMPRNAKLLLCSDGLTNECGNEQLKEILKTCETPQAAVDACIEAALTSGGHDNITAVVICGSGSAKKAE